MERFLCILVVIFILSINAQQDFSISEPLFVRHNFPCGSMLNDPSLNLIFVFDGDRGSFDEIFYDSDCKKLLVSLHTDITIQYIGKHLKTTYYQYSMGIISSHITVNNEIGLEKAKKILNDYQCQVELSKIGLPYDLSSECPEILSDSYYGMYRYNKGLRTFNLSMLQTSDGLNDTNLNIELMASKRINFEDLQIFGDYSGKLSVSGQLKFSNWDNFIHDITNNNYKVFCQEFIDTPTFNANSNNLNLDLSQPSIIINHESTYNLNSNYYGCALVRVNGDKMTYIDVHSTEISLNQENTTETTTQPTTESTTASTETTTAATTTESTTAATTTESTTAETTTSSTTAETTTASTTAETTTASTTAETTTESTTATTESTTATTTEPTTESTSATTTESTTATTTEETTTPTTHPTTEPTTPSDELKITINDIKYIDRGDSLYNLTAAIKYIWPDCPNVYESYNVYYCDANQQNPDSSFSCDDYDVVSCDGNNIHVDLEPDTKFLVVYLEGLNTRPASTYIELLRPGDKKTKKDYWLYIYIGSGILGGIIIISLCYCCCCRSSSKGKKQKGSKNQKKQRGKRGYDDNFLLRNNI